VAKVVSVAGGDTTTVNLEVPTAAPAMPPTTTTTAVTTPPPTNDLSEPSANKHPVPWIGVAVTGVLAAGTIVTGVLALSASSALKNDKDTLGTPRSTLDSDQSSVKRWSITSDVLLAATAVAAAITIVVWTKKPSDDSPKAGASTMTVGFAPSGMTLVGSF
jgi:hypothetical protein